MVASVLLALAAAAIRVDGAARPAAPEVRLASGTLSLTNSLNGAAVLSTQNMKPGDSVPGTVAVTNTGTLDGEFTLSQLNLVDTPGPFGGRLSDGAQLAVAQIASGGSVVSSVYSGTLSGLGTRPLGTLSAGEERHYRFTVTLPDTGTPPAPDAGDNLYQRSSARADYVWTATNDGEGGTGGGATGGGATGGGATGGGWNGGGVDGGWPGGQTPFTLRLSGKTRQRPLRKRPLAVQAWCSSDCRLTWSARIMRARKLRKKRRVRMVPLRAGRLRSRKAISVPAGNRRALKIKLSRRAKRMLRRQLRKKGRVVAVVSVTATSGAVKLTAKRRIALKR